MEPGLGGQEKIQKRPTALATDGGRNGAWPWRPGKAQRVETTARRDAVAMEPGLGGQEKIRGTDFWR